MKFTAAALIAFLAGAKAVSAINVWATFCSDAAGTKDCSIDFQVSNPGCFSVSPGSAKGGCPCQSNKQIFPPNEVGTKGRVIKLNDGVASQPSYRFVSGKAGPNNC